MKFSFIPAGDENTASSRIRVYALHNALIKDGKDSCIGYSSDADVLFVQKKVTKEILVNIDKAKKDGKLILYDIDDVGSALDYWVSPKFFKQMVNLADVITTDTTGHSDFIKNHYSHSCVEIIPDSIDYHPLSSVRLSLKEEKPLRILWFGSISNIALFEKYASVLTSIPGVEVVIATGKSDSELVHLSRKYPKISFVPWSLSSFISTLQSCHLTCLMHDGSDVDRAKSNNKMITSIAWGVPAVVSRTPEYERTAIESGIEYAVFENDAELINIVERLRSPSARNLYMDTSQCVVWNNYSPEAVRQKFLNIVENHMRNKQIKTHSTTQERPTSRLKSAIHYVLNLASKSEQSALPKQTIERDYLRDWVNPEGHKYRLGAYERQRKGGTNPLTTNPSFDEVRTALREHSPKKILEVGCGWGRLIEELVKEFDVEGCDVSEDMLRLCPPTLRVFRYDIAVENIDFLRANEDYWDVIFTRGVMLYFMENPVQMAYAMNNMLMLAKKKIIIWEWPEVCERMRQFSNSPKFEYHPIEHRSE